MKRLHIIYNHDIFDTPYKQTEVKKTDKAIASVIGEAQVLLSFSCLAAPNHFREDADLILVEHTFDLTAEMKKALATVLNQGVTKLKSATPTDVIVSFRKISDDDLYYFEAEKE